MSREYFIASCYWAGRQESTRELGAAALRTFDAISCVTPRCKTWQVADWKAQEMVPLAAHRADMTSLVEQGMAHDDFGDPAPEHGYRLSASNNYESKNDEISIWFLGAMKSSRLNYGSVILTIPPDGPPDPASTNYALMRSILLALVDIWQPDFGLCDASALFPFRRDPSVLFDVAWMTYLSRPLARQIKPPGAVTAELVKGGGLLLIAAEETFDVANPAHLAAAYAIRDVAAPLKSRMPRPWNR